MTMAVELRMTAITGVLEVRSGLNPMWTGSGKSLQSCNKSHYRVFMCTIISITSYDVSIGNWLDLLQLVSQLNVNRL